MQRWALLVPGLLFGACAPAGSGCDPVPGGFAPEARIEGAVQLRLTGSGLTFLGDQVAGLAGTALNQTCGSLTDVPCPTGFVDPVTGAPLTSTCDVNGVCA